MITVYLSTDKWSPESAIIRWGTRFPFSHAGFYNWDDDTYLSAQLFGGVRKRKVGEKPYPEKFSSIAHFAVPGIYQAYAWAIWQIGEAYDWRAILGIATDANWHSGDDYFCSELVAYAFEATGNPLLNPDIVLWRITPRDLTLSMAMTRVA